MRRTVLTRRTALLAGATSLAALGGIAAVERQLFVLGDSWASGLYADPGAALGQVASSRLGLSPAVDAVPGTGYVNGVETGIAYPDRARALTADDRPAIAVVQGGSNDQGSSDADIADGAIETLVCLRLRLPAARLVLLGPGPDPFPVTDAQRAVDRVLQRVAAQQRLPYLSMLRQNWLPASGSADMIDPVNHHPTVLGQQYLGERLAVELRRLFPHLIAPGIRAPRAGDRGPGKSG